MERLEQRDTITLKECEEAARSYLRKTPEVDVYVLDYADRFQVERDG